LSKERSEKLTTCTAKNPSERDKMFAHQRDFGWHMLLKERMRDLEDGDASRFFSLLYASHIKPPSQFAPTFDFVAAG